MGDRERERELDNEKVTGVGRTRRRLNEIISAVDERNVKCFYGINMGTVEKRGEIPS